MVANSDRLLVFDQAWRLVSELSHPWFGGIHDIALDLDGVWVTCANADLVVKVGSEGDIVNRWSWRDDPALAAELGHPSVPPFRHDLDYRDPRVLQGGVHSVGHVNGVARGEGSILVSLGRILPPAEVSWRRTKARLGRVGARIGYLRPDRPPRSASPISPIESSTFAIVEVPDDRGEAARLLLSVRPVSVPNHNVLRQGRDLLYNDSNRDRLVAWDIDSSSIRTTVAVPGDRPFARGLARLDDGRYVVGSQRPARLNIIDLGSATVVDILELGGDPRDAVYAVCVVPESFGPPPPELAFELSGA